MRRPHLRYKYQTPRERTWTIHLISLEKVLKATVMVFVGFKLLTLLGSDVHEWASDFVTRHGIDAANRYVEPLLNKLVGVGDRQLKQFSVAAFGYSSMLYIEGIGLWLQKRWAEYLTVIATALFIPVEIYEILERPTWVRFGALGINIFIVWYLSTRLRDEVAAGPAKTFVKICGITNLEDAECVLEAGADAIGFNFYENSPRFILPQQAAGIAELVGAKALKVGVFVNDPVDEVVEIADRVGLDAVQIHGDEGDEYYDQLRRQLPRDVEMIRAIRVGSPVTPTRIPTAEAILLDAYSKDEFGGTGESFDWETAKKITATNHRVYLAGGLGPDNVGEAIARTNPFAVDACSRLEKRPGVKDHEKVREFVKAAKGEI